MTAMNLIVQRASVSLLSDGALYSPDGTVRAIASKVATSAPLRMAIGGMGRVNPVEIAGYMPSTSQTDVMVALPAIVAEHREANRREAPDYEATPGLNDFQLFVALWSDITDRPEAWIIASDTVCFGAGHRAGTLAEVEQVWMPRLKRCAFDPATFKAKRDGRRAFAEQRQHRHTDGRNYIGGFGELTTVTREGVSQQRLIEWPDRVGERIAA